MSPKELPREVGGVARVTASPGVLCSRWQAHYPLSPKEGGAVCVLSSAFRVLTRGPRAWLARLAWPAEPAYSRTLWLGEPSPSSCVPDTGPRTPPCPAVRRPSHVSTGCRRGAPACGRSRWWLSGLLAEPAAVGTMSLWLC